MTEDGTTTTYELSDRERTVRFAGVMLGEATSRWRTHSGHSDTYARRFSRCGACRWTEVRVYRTEAGSYVVETVGRSLVPDEVDLSRVTVSESAAGAVETLHTYDADEVRYITKTAREAALAAAALDDAFAEAFMVEEVA